jgi:hypothetical protein
MARIPTITRNNNIVTIECQDEELAIMIENQMKQALSNRAVMFAAYRGKKKLDG